MIKKMKKLLKNTFPQLFLNIREMYRLFMHNRRKRIPEDKYQYYVGKKYKQIFGCECNFLNPQKYSEKIQWLKLYDDNELRTTLTDKAEVRSWISEKIGDKYLIPIIGIYESVDEIDFDNLPNQYVIKMNHGSGWNIIVKDKKTAIIKKIKKQISKWMKLNYAYWNVFEIHYKNIKPKIVIEKYIEDKKGELNDFKFLCFDGKVEFFWIDFDRNTNHKRNVYDLNWNLQPWTQRNYGNYEGTVTKPENFDEMVKIASKLCKGFKHVRVDLYNVDGTVYFGEMTFTNGSGYEGIYPSEYEYYLGKFIKLPTDK